MRKCLTRKVDARLAWRLDNISQMSDFDPANMAEYLSLRSQVYASFAVAGLNRWKRDSGDGQMMARNGCQDVQIAARIKRMVQHRMNQLIYHCTLGAAIQ